MYHTSKNVQTVCKPCMLNNWSGFTLEKVIGGDQYIYEICAVNVPYLVS